MACRNLLGLLALMCGGVWSTPPSDCTVEDGTALHQKLIRLHSGAGESASPEAVTPNKKQLSKVKPEIREIAEGVFKRVTTKAKLPSVPAVFRWELVGKVTKWGLDQYQKPRSAAALELLESVLGLASEVAGRPDFALLEDVELSHRLGNVSRLHPMLRRFLQQSGAPPAVTKLMDATAEASQSQGAVDPKILMDVANETGGPALATLLAYGKDVSEGKEKLNVSKTFDLYIPVLTRLGAPPALATYLNGTADMMRHKVFPNPINESIRSQKMLAEAARELGLPSAIPEALDYMVQLTAARLPPKHYIQNPGEVGKILIHLNGLFAELSEQLGGPPAMSELLHRLAGPLQNQTPPSEADILNLLAKASRQLSFPGAVPELFEYVASANGNSESLDPEHVKDLLVQLSQQAGAPEPLAKFGKEVTALAQKDGKPDPNKLSKLISQLLKKLGMPAMGDIYGKVVGPVLLKGKKPDPLAMAAVTPSLTKILPDIETASGLVRDMRAKLFSPLVPLYDQAVETMTGKMPESPLKSALKLVLSKTRPPA